MIRSLLLVSVLAALWSPAAFALRPPLQSDVDRCALEAQGRGAAPQGRIQLSLLLRRSGQVYAAHVRAAGGVDDPRLQRCLATVATRWQFPEAALDGRRPFSLSMVPGGTTITNRGSQQTRPSVFLPDLSQTDAELPLEAAVARASLEVLDGATHAERGEAMREVRAPAEALAELRLALEESPSDPVALRALSQALVELAQVVDQAAGAPAALAEARSAAEQLLALDPESAAGHEALLRVCLAAGDDACAFGSWQAARAAHDLQPRARALSELTGPTRAAAARLQALALASPPPAPVCGGDQGSEQQALCVVRLCLDEGTWSYSQSLAAQNGERYRLDAWRAHDAGSGRVVVTRPIVADAGRPGSHHDAVWLVKVGGEIRVTPVSPEARQITAQGSRCGSRAVAARTIGLR